MTTFFSSILSSNRNLPVMNNNNTNATFEKISFKKTLVRGDFKKYFQSAEEFFESLKFFGLDEESYKKKLKEFDTNIANKEKQKEKRIVESREKGEDYTILEKTLTERIFEEKRKKQNFVNNRKKLREKIEKIGVQHNVFNITGDDLTIECNENGVVKKYTTRGVQQEILKRMKNDNGHGLYHRYLKNTPDFNSPDLVKQVQNIVGDVCFKFKEEEKSLMNRMLNANTKEKDDIKSKTKSNYIYVLVPVYKSQRSNLNGNQLDELLNAQKNHNKSSQVDFSNFIDFNKPYITYNFSQKDRSGIEYEKSHVIVMMTSNIHVSYPRIEDFIPVTGTTTLLNGKLNVGGFYNENAESPEMSCKPIYENGSIMVEKNSTLADDGKILNIEQQLEALSRTTPGQILLGLLLILIAYLMIYGTIYGLYYGPASIFTGSKRIGTLFGVSSMKFSNMRPMNAAHK